MKDPPDATKTQHSLINKQILKKKKKKWGHHGAVAVVWPVPLGLWWQWPCDISNETSSGLPRVKHSYYIFIPILYEPALPQSLLPFLFRPCLFLPSWFHSLKSLHCSRGQETRAVGALAEKWLPSNPSSFFQGQRLFAFWEKRKKLPFSWVPG